MRAATKYKICRRLGSNVFEKCQTQKFALSAERKSRTAKRSNRPRSEFGRQLIEKQKVRYGYGLSERQLSNYVKESLSASGNSPAQVFLMVLESRLDNVVYRLGLAPTRSAARQMVSHGHITVNDRKVTIPSYRVQTGERIAIREGSRGKTLFATLAERFENHTLPGWLTFDIKKHAGEVTHMPGAGLEELPFDPLVVLEYYTR